MKLSKRAGTLLIASFLAMSAFAGCGDSGTPSSSASSAEASGAPDASQGSAASTSAESSSTGTEAGKINYPLTNGAEFTLAITEMPQVTANATDLGATPFGQAWQEATGVKLKVTHPAGTDGFNLLFASGDLPDLIYYNFFTYSGGPSKAIKDKIIVPLEDLVDENAPDLKRVLESNDIYRKSATSPDGHLIGFPFIRGDDRLCSSSGMIIRQDWLDDLNLPVPETPDELYETLKAFRDEKGAEVPFTATTYWLRDIALSMGLITAPFGLPQTSYYQDNGEIHYGYAEPGYKDLLAYLNKLYTEGLLDNNFATLDDNTRNANIMNGVSGVTPAFVGSGIGNYLQTMEEKDPKFDLTGFGPLVANKGDVSIGGCHDNPIGGDMCVITPACKDPETAAQFLNFGYSDEGHMLFNFGIEGVSYEMKDGVPTYTDLITHNPDGWTMQMAMAQYCLSWSTGPLVQDYQYIAQYAARPQQQAALEKWSDTGAAAYKLPPLTIAEADSAEYSKLNGDIKTYVNEMLVKFITGTVPLDSFESEYLPTLQSMGLDRVIEMQQNALNEFNAR